jgi:hypothetical protein
MTRFKTKILLTFLQGMLTLVAHSQVTIGSGDEPAPGAILQLKEQEVNGSLPNSNKGFELPRVELTDKNQLFPMFQSDGTGGYKIGSTPYVKATEDAEHAGLFVYHTGNQQITKGVYYWNGQEWMPTQGAWYAQGTSYPADSNTQSIYHQGNVSIGDPASNAEFTINGKIKITDSAAVYPAPVFFKLVYNLHGAYLWRAR